MNRIWRYDVGAADDVVISVPTGATFLPKIVASDRQPDSFTIWAEVDPSAPKTDRTLHVYGTGNPKPAVGRYVGTFQLHGWLWFHVFEEETDVISSFDGIALREVRR